MPNAWRAFIPSEHASKKKHPTVESQLRCVRTDTREGIRFCTHFHKSTKPGHESSKQLATTAQTNNVSHGLTSDVSHVRDSDIWKTGYNREPLCPGACSGARMRNARQMGNCDSETRHQRRYHTALVMDLSNAQGRLGRVVGAALRNCNVSSDHNCLAPERSAPKLEKPLIA